MKFLYLILSLFSVQVYAQSPHWKNVETNLDVSFRAMSAVDDSIVWIGGSKGTVGKSMDGGNSWRFMRLAGFEQAEFRSLYAINATTVIVANAGSPAYILRTTNGGQSWDSMYANMDTAAFFDGIDFWDEEHGIIYGDPIRDRMLLLSTSDGGKTWQELPKTSRPVLKQGEASFAASGTGIRCYEKNKIAITTGGKESRVFISESGGEKWRYVNAPILKGEASTGIFSIVRRDNVSFIVVGGDYKNEKRSDNNVYVLYNMNKDFSWKAVATPTRGYRECVEMIDKKTAVAVGPGGTDISYDAGVNWTALSDDGFHVVRKSRNGGLVIAAGAKGRIGILK